MPITLSCPSCNREMTARDNLAGQTRTCPNCQSDITIPSAIDKPPVISSDEKIGIQNDACSSEQAEQDSAVNIDTKKEDVAVADENTASPLSSEAIDETSGDSVDSPKPTSPNQLDADEAATSAEQSISTETTECESPSDVTGSILSELKPLLMELRDKLDSLTSDVNFGKEFAAKKQEQIDKLYEENRKYRDDIIGAFKQKLVLGVIEQLSKTDRMVQNFENKEGSEKNYKNLLEAFRELTDDFRDMLSNRFNVDAYRTKPGEMLVAEKHQVLSDGFVTTNDEAKKDMIVSSVRHGYICGGKILRQEIVKIYSYQVSSDPPLPNDSQSKEQTLPISEAQETQET